MKIVSRWKGVHAIHCFEVEALYWEKISWDSELRSLLGWIQEQKQRHHWIHETCCFSAPGVKCQMYLHFAVLNAYIINISVLFQVSNQLATAEWASYWLFTLLLLEVFPKIGRKPPKWMVKIMENPIKHGMFWGKHPLSLEIPQWGLSGGFLFDGPKAPRVGLSTNHQATKRTMDSISRSLMQFK